MASRRQLAAIMFTDIAGFTAMMQRSEREAVDAVRRHQEMLETTVPQHGGEVLEYYGDGSLSIFQSAIEAVHCAVKLQQQYRQAPAIPVRIGIHLGEVLFEDGKALGNCVNIASRIEAIAAEGSVLISEHVCREIANKGIFRLQPLGGFHFKNVLQPVGLFAVEAEALYVPDREELAGQAPGHQKIKALPRYPNTFIGRVHQLNTVTDLLLRENKRLITLIGPGGMGKTRLSVKVGELLAEDFQHGVCFVALDAVSDPGQVPLYIGHRLGLKTAFNRSWTDTIIDFLTDRELLLILDNLEQIPESASVIATILEHCPAVRILATSREVLGLPEETEYPLDSLNRPNPRLFPHPEDLLRFDAIKLFVQKAKATLPGFRLNADNALAIVEICQTLEGLPLPIELAAARVKLFSPEVIRQKLAVSSDLLKTNSKAVPSRHQTIRNTVRWSYDLLDGEEQQLFQQLALFSGGFTPEALEAVCPEYDPLEVLESFINKSLIVKDREVQHSPRFRMLKLIRDYGLEKLAGNPERAASYRHFARHFSDFVDQGANKLRSPEQGRWIALLEAEYENIGIALSWLLENDPAGAARLGSGFWRFHLARGFLREGLDMVRQLLSLSLPEKRVRAVLLEGAGTFSHNLGNYPDASYYFQECLDLWNDLDDNKEITKALNNVAWAEWRTGNYDQTIAYSEKALSIAEALDDEPGQARALNNLAWTYHFRGLFEKTEGLQQKILEIHTRADNARGIAFAKTNLGWAQLMCGRLAEAEPRINEGIELFEALKDQQLTAFSRLVRVAFLSENGHYEAAETLLLTHCLPVFKKIGDVFGMAHSHKTLGSIRLLRENLSGARQPLSKAMELFQGSHDIYGRADTAYWLSRLYWQSGNEPMATKYIDQSLSLAAPMQAWELLMKGHFERGRQAYQQKLPEAALRSFAAAGHCAGKMGTYRYQQYAAAMQPYLDPLRKAANAKNPDMLSRLTTTEWPQEEGYPDGLPGKTALREHMEKLLRPANFNSPPAGARYKDIDSPAEAPFVRKARLAVERHLKDPHFGVQDLCRELTVSHSQLHRRLTDGAGMSTTRFIRAIRLEKAKELLGDPGLTITAVAYDTGFKDPDYFYRVFKKEFGMTPGAFRQTHIR